MKIQYITVKNIKLNFDLSLIDYLKKLTNINVRSLEIWKNAYFTLINDDQTVIWMKKFEDINEKDLKINNDNKNY